MTLTDLMSGSGLVAFAEAALVLFLLAFAGVLVRTFAPARRAELENAGRMPLQDDSTRASGPGSLT